MRLWDTLSPPSIFNPRTPWGVQWNRKQEENECKRTKRRQKHALKLWTRSLHVMMILIIYACLFTWATIADLFSISPIIQRPTHHSHSTYTQKSMLQRKKYTPCCLLVWIQMSSIIVQYDNLNQHHMQWWRKYSEGKVAMAHVKLFPLPVIPLQAKTLHSKMLFK